MDEETKPTRATFALNEHFSGNAISIGVTIPILLRLVLVVFFLIQVAVVIALIVKDRFDLTMYTYWSYTILTVFFALAVVALFTERWFLHFVTMYIFPIPLGSTFLVALSIVIIIQENQEVLVSNDNAGLALSLIHTGDWILHSLPVIEILLLMVCGWLLYARLIIGNRLATMKSAGNRTGYIIYFLLVPLVPMAIYSIAFDPAVHYPTGIPTYVLWIALVAIDLIWMTLMYLALTSSANVQITLLRQRAGGSKHIASTPTTAAVSSVVVATAAAPPPQQEHVMAATVTLPVSEVDLELASNRNEPVIFMSPSPSSPVSFNYASGKNPENVSVSQPILSRLSAGFNNSAVQLKRAAAKNNLSVEDL